MNDTIQHRRGLKADLPELERAELGVTLDSEELFVGGESGNIPVLTLKQAAGGRIGIDKLVTENSDSLITSGAVFSALQASGGGGGGYAPEGEVHANSVRFADGETLQEKHDNEAFTDHIDCGTF